MSLGCRIWRNHWRDQTVFGGRCTWSTKPTELSAGILLHLSFLVSCDCCYVVTNKVDVIGERVQMPKQEAVVLPDRQSPGSANVPQNRGSPRASGDYTSKDATPRDKSEKNRTIHRKGSRGRRPAKMRWGPYKVIEINIYFGLIKCKKVFGKFFSNFGMEGGLMVRTLKMFGPPIAYSIQPPPKPRFAV